MKDRIIDFIFKMYTEDNGKPSWTRATLTGVLMCSCMWVTVLVFAKGVLPDLIGLGVFIGAVGTVTYGYRLASQAYVDTRQPEPPKPI